MASVDPKYHEILLRLADEGVDVIVVGMTAAVLQGVPLTTWDLDVVHRRTPDNVERLLRVLHDLEAVGATIPGVSNRTKPLERLGHVLMKTRFGDFDCLGAIDGGRDYDALIESSVEVDFEGRPLRLLSLRRFWRSRSVRPARRIWRRSHTSSRRSRRSSGPQRDRVWRATKVARRHLWMLVNQATPFATSDSYSARTSPSAGCRSRTSRAAGVRS